jgi:hypothetical protein
MQATIVKSRQRKLAIHVYLMLPLFQLAQFLKFVKLTFQNKNLNSERKCFNKLNKGRLNILKTKEDSK